MVIYFLKYKYKKRIHNRLILCESYFKEERIGKLMNTYKLYYFNMTILSSNKQFTKYSKNVDSFYFVMSSNFIVILSMCYLKARVNPLSIAEKIKNYKKIKKSILKLILICFL